MGGLLLYKILYESFVIKTTNHLFEYNNSNFYGCVAMYQLKPLYDLILNNFEITCYDSIQIMVCFVVEMHKIAEIMALEVSVYGRSRMFCWLLSAYARYNIR